MRPLLVIGILAVAAGAVPGSYKQNIEAWRTDREHSLKGKEGWLTVAGLFWLKDGENRAGSDPSYEIALPPLRAPKRIGVFDLHHGTVSFRLASGAHVTVNGKPVVTADLKSDSSGKPDYLQFGDFTMFIIKRGDRLAIRLRDQHSQMRENFAGLQWYAVNERYRITARWVAYGQPRKIAIANVVGQTGDELSPGYAQFTLKGGRYRLEPILEDHQLFFVFRDATAGKTTYGAGRFLYAEMPQHDKVILDFNKAYNPPCAFTPFATCPLPPKQNRLSVAIEAGELKYGNH